MFMQTMTVFEEGARDIIRLNADTLHLGNAARVLPLLRSTILLGDTLQRDQRTRGATEAPNDQAPVHGEATA